MSCSTNQSQRCMRGVLSSSIVARGLTKTCSGARKCGRVASKRLLASPTVACISIASAAASPPMVRSTRVTGISPRCRLLCLSKYTECPRPPFTGNMHCARYSQDALTQCTHCAYIASHITQYALRPRSTIFPAFEHTGIELLPDGRIVSTRIAPCGLLGKSNFYQHQHGQHVYFEHGHV